MIITAGKTDVSVYVFFVDDDSGTNPGEPTTGLLFSDIETGGSASYARQGAARVDFELFTLASASAAHTDGGFILVDDTNMPGLYRLDIPDAALATAVDQVIIQLVAATGKNTTMRPIVVDITDVDLRDSVRGGMTALPNAAADGAFGLPISDAGGLDLDTQLAETDEITAVRMATLTDWIDGGRLDLILDARMAETSIDTTAGAVDTVSTVTNGVGLTAAAVDAIWDELMADHQVDASFGLGLNAIDAGSASAGTANTITLDSDTASAVADIHNDATIEIVGGTGAGQTRRIIDYAVTTFIATVEPNWITNPASGSKYVVRAGGNANLRTATQTSIDQIEIDTNSLNDTKIPNTLNTTATGNIGIDWANVENPTTALDLAGTDMQLVDTCTANTDMRGTDSAALASVLGALTDAAAVGDPTTADTLMQYVKQLLNVLVGTTGIGVYPAEQPPGNGINLFEVISAIHADVTDITLPGQEAPPLSPTLSEAVGWLYKIARNRTTQTATQWSLLADNETTVDAKATVSDDATTAIKQEIITGP